MRFVLCGLVLVSAAAGSGAQPAPAAWVTVKGQVVLPAAVGVPAAAPLNVAGCPAKGAVLNPAVLVNAKNRGVKNAVVWLRPDNATNPKAAFAANQIHPGDANRKPADVVIDQPCCLFEPHIAAARVGDTVVVKNSAAVNHNFFWTSGNNGELNVTIEPNKQYRFVQPLVAESAPIQYKCTIHPWMVGYVRVFDHPYYAVTDDDGKFEIRNAPAGNYRLVYWHENVGFKGGRDGRFGELVMIRAGADGTMQMNPTDFDVTR